MEPITPQSLPDFYTGAPIDPPDLWFRDEFIASLWEVLRTHHALLTAPRRTGKTSVMDHLVAFPKNSFSPVRVFVQDLDHPGEFMLTVLDAFHDRHPHLFRKIFSKGSKLIGKVLANVKEVDVAGFKVALREGDADWSANWKGHGEDFFRQVRQAGNPVLFIVDEFPDLVINIQRYHAELLRPFLAWFRGHRLTPHPKQDPVRWLLGGSVNLSSTLDALGCLDEINDMQDVPLPPLTQAQVIEFVRRMLSGRGVEMKSTLPGKLAKHLGQPVPVFLQMITQDLYRIWKRTGRVLTSADVDRAFNDLVVSSAARDKLQHYHSRIARYYGEPKGSAAHELLSRLSRHEDGLDRANLVQEFERVLHADGVNSPRHERQRLFNQLLRDLENDFYVVEVGPNRYDFASGLIKAWWRKYYA